ncbi:hypothetical protein [Variovorax sp. DAIF25]|uniref:hypothetical protein n=1 Tax=Variovorax sp. DAIF25 TaxID=3080983 RepID=UPI003D6A4CF1
MTKNYFFKLCLLFLASFHGNSFAEGKYAACLWKDGSDYYIYEIDDQKEEFKFSTTFDYGTDALSRVPHKENANYREYVKSFSKQKIEHCRLNKSKGIESCYALNRVNGTLSRTYGDRPAEVTSCSAGLPTSKI